MIYMKLSPSIPILLYDKFVERKVIVEEKASFWCLLCHENPERSTWVWSKAKFIPSFKDKLIIDNHMRTIHKSFYNFLRAGVEDDLEHTQNLISVLEGALQ